MGKMARHKMGDDNVDTQDIAKSSCAQALFVHLLCACFMLGFLYSLGVVQKSQLHSACHVIRPERSALHNKDCIAAGFKQIKARKKRQLSLHIKDLAVQ